MFGHPSHTKTAHIKAFCPNCGEPATLKNKISDWATFECPVCGNVELHGTEIYVQRRVR